MKKKTQGFNLIELMLVFAVLAAAILLATRYFRITESSQQVNDAAGMLHAVYTAAASNSDFADFKTNNMIPEWVSRGDLPDKFAVSTSNPWGGSIKATAVKKGSRVEGDDLKVTMSSVPHKACINLREKFAQKTDFSSPSCGDTDPTTFSIVFKFVE